MRVTNDIKNGHEKKSIHQFYVKVKIRGEKKLLHMIVVRDSQMVVERHKWPVDVCTHTKRQRVFFLSLLASKAFSNVLGMFFTLHSFYMSLLLRHPTSVVIPSMSFAFFYLIFGRFCMHAGTKRKIQFRKCQRRE